MSRTVTTARLKPNLAIRIAARRRLPATNAINEYLVFIFYIEAAIM